RRARVPSVTVSVAEPDLRLRRSEPAERELPRRSLRAVLASTVSPAVTAQARGQRTFTRTERLPDALSWNTGRVSDVGVAVATGVGVGVLVAGSAVAVGTAVAVAVAVGSTVG